MYGRTAQNKYQMKEKLLGKTPEELRERGFRNSPPDRWPSGFIRRKSGQ